MQRRRFLQALTALGVMGGPLRALAATTPGAGSAARTAVSVDELPPLEGELTVYLGRGEGGLYENVMDAIRKRNPSLTLNLRRGPSAALANTITAEHEAGIQRADVFWAVDSGSLGLVADTGAARPIPDDIHAFLRPSFRYPGWAPVTGRVRTLPYNTERVDPAAIPEDIMALPETDLRIGWAPAYGSFQSFVTAMRLTEGDARTREWLRGMQARASSYAGELGVVMATERGEVDLGLANHYYTLRLKAGMPEASVALAFTRGDAGSLLNAAGAMVLNPGETAFNFVRYLLTREVQGYLAREAYEIPLVSGVDMPEGLPPLSRIQPPDMDLTRLSELQPTLALMRDVGVL
ncbi:ABC transporter substrate-binding protein [Arhodomonas sp. KWT2]